jgi:16S rRNA (guanine(966)-N(2))-methyltransferase RsmD
MDRMRESVFAALCSIHSRQREAPEDLGSLEGLSFLDLFSGSGIIGIEAASRGARPVTCVEKDRDKFPQLLRNVAIAGGAIVCKSQSVELFLARNKIAHDIVFCDPPFPYRYRTELLSRLESGESLKPSALVLMHFPHEDRPPETVGSLAVEDERVYGRSIVRFYRNAR